MKEGMKLEHPEKPLTPSFTSFHRFGASKGITVLGTAQPAPVFSLHCDPRDLTLHVTSVKVVGRLGSISCTKLVCVSF